MVEIAKLVKDRYNCFFVGYSDEYSSKIKNLDIPVAIGFFVTFGENFLFGFNLKNRNDQEPANFYRNLH